MNRILYLAVALFMTGASASAQQQAQFERQGEVISITLADGTTQTITIADDEVIRLVVRDGEVVLIRQPVLRDLQAYALGHAAAGDFEDIEIEIGTVFERLPELIRERMEGVTLPRIRVEQDIPADLRRDVSDAERQARRLALELRRAERDGQTAEARRLQAELDRTLERAFDLNQEARRARLEAVEQRQAELREQAGELSDELRARETRRAEIIERRRQELTRERESLDW